MCERRREEDEQRQRWSPRLRGEHHPRVYAKRCRETSAAYLRWPSISSMPAGAAGCGCGAGGVGTGGAGTDGAATCGGGAAAAEADGVSVRRLGGGVVALCRFPATLVEPAPASTGAAPPLGSGVGIAVGACAVIALGTGLFGSGFVVTATVAGPAGARGFTARARRNTAEAPPAATSTKMPSKSGPRRLRGRCVVDQGAPVASFVTSPLEGTARLARTRPS